MHARNETYLYNRQGVFYYRQSVTGKDKSFELKLSLRTKSKRLAEERYLMIRIFLQRLIIQETKTGETGGYRMSLNAADIKSLVHQYFLERFIAIEGDGGMPPNDNERQEQIHNLYTNVSGILESENLDTDPGLAPEKSYDAYIAAWKKGIPP